MLKYAQAELAQAKATYETGRRHCEEIAAAIEKIKGLSQYSEQNIDRKKDEHIISICKSSSHAQPFPRD